MLCWLADDHNLHLEEIASNFEIINKRILSIAGRMFKPDRYFRQLGLKIEALMFINHTDFKH